MSPHVLWTCAQGVPCVVRLRRGGRGHLGTGAIGGVVKVVCYLLQRVFPPTALTGIANNLVVIDTVPGSKKDRIQQVIIP